MTTMLFRTSASVIALVACSSFAVAADLEGPVGYSLKDDGYVAPAAYSWTGFYVGGHVGYGWADNDTSSVTTDKDGKIWINPSSGPLVGSNSYDSDGWLGGLQLGYNYQSGRLVIGIEGDYSWTDMNGSFVYDPRPEKADKDKTAGVGIDWIATIRGRAGYAFDRALVYGTAGVAFAEFDGYVNNFWTEGNGERASGSSTETGWVAGGGVEFALTQNLTVRGEYLYMHFDSSGAMRAENWPDGTKMHVDNDVDIHTVRVGVNYKFGG